jgi:heptosyltransferase-3
MKIIDPSTYKLPADVRNVLLIQLGDIGDVVWTTPTIRAARSAVPDGKLSILVREGFGSLLEADPSVDRVFETKHYSGNLFHQAAGQLAFLGDIRARHFDLAVDLRLGDRGAFLSMATGAPIRVTMHLPEGLPFWRKLCFTHGVVPVGDGIIKHRGATEQILRIVRPLGMDTQDLSPRLWVSDTVKRRVGEILSREKANGQKNWISINPFSRWSYKEWGDLKWAHVINWLWKDRGIPSVIIGSAEERQRAEAIIRHCETRVINLAGRTTLAELAGVLSLSSLHIGVDSAAPHIAAAAGVPTITIYGPSSWFDWAPVGENHRVILPEMDCVPCHQKGCNGSGQSRCLDELNPEQVIPVIREALNIPAVKPVF